MKHIMDWVSALELMLAERLADPVTRFQSGFNKDEHTPGAFLLLPKKHASLFAEKHTFLFANFHALEFSSNIFIE